MYFLRVGRVNLAAVRKLNYSYFEMVARQPFDLKEKELRRLSVVYGPSNGRTDKLVKKILEKSNIPFTPPSYDDYTDETTPLDDSDVFYDTSYKLAPGVKPSL
ncbi:hypothetical protein MTO96_030214 [Rhipicephalus appendiculatus]